MIARNDFTILLTLKDSASYTFRWLNYINSIGFPFKIFIADGGSRSVNFNHIIAADVLIEISS
jgi:hypothetical protein